MPIENVLASYGIPKDVLVYSQEATQGSDVAVSFEDGLRSAIAAFLNDQKGTGSGNSPLAAIMAVPDAHGLDASASAAECSAKLLEYLKTDPKAEIVLLTPTTMANDIYRFPPEDGESVDDNWVFRFLLPTTFDLLMWSVVDRSGKSPAYCYSVE